jgi:predicted TIM-barrel fold metal-dependent hydrolase
MSAPGDAEILEARMTAYRAYIVGQHDRFIGVVQLDCMDDETAIKSASRLVDSHDVELWQMDRPVARFDARSKQMCRK